MFSLETYLHQKTQLVDAELRRILQPTGEAPAKLLEAMSYSLFAGGKRLRPILVLASAFAIAGSPSLERHLLPVACAIECLHTYSLIHDDLPAMDDDDWRRGRPSNHKVFGSAMAILAGDGLLTLAFELLGQEQGMFEPKYLLRVIQEIAHAAGYRGMVGGQAADILGQDDCASGADRVQMLEYIHRNKTGALITASIRAGALLAGAGQGQLASLTSYGHAFGMAFQVADDLLDCYGDEEKMGKEMGRDVALGKLTYPLVYGEAQSRAKIEQLLRAALTALQDFGEEADVLRSLVRFAVTRDH